MNTLLQLIYRNLPNMVSFLGVLPLCILLREDAFVYLCPLIVFNNIMDDLDGILATKLNLRSEFGARLDNVCDAVALILVVMVIGTHFGGVVLGFSLLAAVAILVRIVRRLDPSPATGAGTATNELMRPMLLVLVGGGHVNLQVAKIAEILGFRVMVTDDRPEFANEERFGMAEAVSVAPYDKGLGAFPINQNTAIVVGTRGHNFDDSALEAAVRTDAAYVGLLGSKRKTILIYEALLKRGISADRLKAVHSPVGLDLGGRTPEEIALSIMSEIVAFWYGHDGGTMKIEDAQVDRISKKLRGAAAR